MGHGLYKDAFIYIFFYSPLGSTSLSLIYNRVLNCFLANFVDIFTKILLSAYAYEMSCLNLYFIES